MRARYEYKYLIDEDQADWIRELVRCFCEPDAYGDDGVYSVNSLYFDTVDWLTARQTLEGVLQRFKLRIRTYGWTDDDPVFLENKGRVGTTILKRRALMDRRLVHALSVGEPAAEGFHTLKPDHQPELEDFRNTMDAFDMRPRLWVRYEREAWGSTYGDGARLTFDRNLQVQAPGRGSPYAPDHTRWTTVPLYGDFPYRYTERPPVCILEMKFNDASPRWMQTVVHQLGLLRVSVSKYVRGAEHLGDVPWNRYERSSAWTA